MLPWIFAAFITIPIAEIAVFIEVGDRFGLWPTLAGIFGTALAGTYLIRQQGISVFKEVQRKLDAGEFPAKQVFDGLCLLVAGALLLTPGFITDAIGFILLVPLTRNIISAGVLARVAVHHAGLGNPPGRPQGNPSGVHVDANGTIIDGEFVDVTTETSDKTSSPTGKILPPE